MTEPKLILIYIGMGVAVLLIILLIIALILMVIRAKQKLRELDEDVRMRSHQRSVQAMMQAEKRKLYDKMSTQMAPPNRQYSHGSTNTLPISDVLYFKSEDDNDAAQTVVIRTVGDAHAQNHVVAENEENTSQPMHYKMQPPSRRPVSSQVSTSDTDSDTNKVPAMNPNKKRRAHTRAPRITNSLEKTERESETLRTSPDVKGAGSISHSSTSDDEYDISANNHVTATATGEGLQLKALEYAMQHLDWQNDVKQGDGVVVMV